MIVNHDTLQIAPYFLRIKASLKSKTLRRSLVGAMLNYQHLWLVSLDILEEITARTFQSAIDALGPQLPATQSPYHSFVM